MKVSFKNANNFARTLRTRSSPDDEPRLDPLFEADWDEFVIRFDEARGEFVAKKATQPIVDEYTETIG